MSMGKRRRHVIGWLSASTALALIASCSGGGVPSTIGGMETGGPVTPSSAGSASASPSLPPGVPQLLRSDLPRGQAGKPETAGTALDDLGAALLRGLPAG